MSQDVTYKEIMVEMLSENPTFGDLCDVMGTVFEDNIDFPLDQLLRLRSVNQNDDIELRRNALRLLGFDVTRDFVQLNDNISQIPYMFSRYYENAHSDDFWRFISFVLGRQVVVTSLYTNDYKNFYSTPYGTENIDGGDWYKTTHVDVSVDIDGLGDKLVANIGKSFQDRILDLFFEFAPIQLVVNRFLFSLSLKTNFSFIGGLVRDVDMLFIGGQGLYGGQSLDSLLGVEIDGLISIIEQTTQQYKLKLTWPAIKAGDPPYTETIPFGKFTVSDFTRLTVDEFGNATAGSVNASTSVTLYANYGPYSVSKMIGIIDVNSLIHEIAITILGADIVSENSTQQYTVQVIWSNGTKTVTSTGSNLDWTSLNPTISFYDPTKGSLTVNSVNADTSNVVMYLYYTTAIGTVLKTSKTIKVLNVDTNIFLSSIQITGPSLTLNEGQTYLNNDPNDNGNNNGFRCLAIFSDHHEEEITPLWYLNSTAGKIATDGSLTTYKNIKTLKTPRDPLTGAIIGPSPFLLTATYEYKGITCQARADLTVIHTDEYIVTGNIVNNINLDTVLQKTQVQFYLSILWSDGTQTYVKPDYWTTSDFTIDETGLLSVGTINDNVSFEVTAYFTYLSQINPITGLPEGVTNVYTASMRAVKEIVKADYVSVRGPQLIQPLLITNGVIVHPGTISLVAYVHNSDGSRSVIDPTSGYVKWAIDPASQAYATIGSSGTLKLLANPVPSIITVSITYDDTVIHVPLKAEYYVTVYVPQLTVTSIDIFGPDSLMELSKDQYTVKVNMSDGSKITPDAGSVDFTLMPTETQYTSADELARIDRKGFISVRSLSADTKIILIASYFGAIKKKLVTLTKYVPIKKGPPYSAAIVGPDTIDPVIGYAQFTLYIKDDALSAAYAVSAEWSLTANVDIATVDEFGVVRQLKYIALNTLLTATYSCGYGTPIVATKQLHLTGTVNTGGVNIYGPSIIFDQSSTHYTASIVQTDGTVLDVTVTPDTTWTLENVSTPLAGDFLLSNEGLLVVQQLPSTQPVTLKVDYIQQFNSYTGTKDVMVLVAGPTYGVGPFGVIDQALADTWVTNQMSTKVSGGFLTIAVPLQSYGYFMCPVEYGLVTFTDVASLIPGGWDGATWPNGEIGNTDGPLTIDIVRSGITKQYYLYRTDFDGLGVVEFRVDYANR